MISLVRSVCKPSVQKIPRLEIVRWCQTRTNQPGYTPLLDLVRQRQNQARSSVLVQVAGQESASDLASYCQENFGEVDSLHYYQNKDNRSFTHFFIVQFRDADSVTGVLRSAEHSGGEGTGAAVPVYSPFLWLQGADSQNYNKSLRAKGVNVPVDFGMRDTNSLEQMVSWPNVEASFHTRQSLSRSEICPTRRNRCTTYGSTTT